MFGVEAMYTGEAVGAPDAPSNLTAVEKTCSGTGADVELTFDDSSNNETAWVVYKDGGFFDEVSSSTEGTTGQVTITASGPLASGETASFTVAAKNGNGTSDQSNSSSVTIKTASAAPSGLTASWNDEFCYVSLSWNDNSAGSDQECHFNVYRDGAKIGTASQDGTGFTDNDASANKSYTYEVSAVNDRGESAKDSTSITTGACDGGPV